MSKIGAKTIVIPPNVTVTVNGLLVSIKGKNGELKINLPKTLEIKRNGDKITLERKGETKKISSLHGLFRQLIYNAVCGVEKFWEKKLEIVGTGFNVKLQGEDLLFKLGFSHPVLFKQVPGIKYQVEGNNKFSVFGADKQLVGEIANQIKIIKKPDAYKGKGIRYQGEVIKLKPSKKVKAAGAGVGAAAG